MQEYKNNTKGSEIDSILISTETPKPYIFIKYKDQTITCHPYCYIIPLLNKSKQGEAMYLSEEVKKQIVQESKGILNHNHEIYALDTEELKKLHEATNITLDNIKTDYAQKLLSIKPTVLPWYKFEDNFTCILRAAHKMLDEHPNARIFSLGQSPAWIIKAAEYINKLKSEPCEFGYIPFSGRFYQCTNSDQIDSFTNPEYRYSPPILLPEIFERRKQMYSSELIKTGMSPKLIVDEYNSSNKITVIADYVFLGSGLVSFLHILFSLAKQQQVPIADLKSAIRVVAFVSSEAKSRKSFTFDEQTIECDCQVFEEIEDFANSINSGPYSDRLVTSYSLYDWTHPPSCEIIENKELIDFLNKKLTRCIEQHSDVLINHHDFSNLLATTMGNKKIIDSSTIGSIRYVEQHPDARDDINNFAIENVSVDLSGTVFNTLANVIN